MNTFITVLHVLVCLFLMLTVLLQSGKGGMGAAFGGGGGTQTVFGGSGAGSFLRRLTVAAAVIFMLTSITLAWLSSRTGTDALKRYSAQQRHAAEVKKAAHLKALRPTRDAGAETSTTGDAGSDTVPNTSGDGGTLETSPTGDVDDQGSVEPVMEGKKPAGIDSTAEKSRGPPSPDNN